MSNIILIGFMGCGKSTVGIRLSYKMRCVLEDTDKRIEKEQGKAISEIFSENGESYFRDLETACLEKLLSENTRRIISVGGGLPLRSENRKLLKQLGTVVYLKITPERVYERLKGDKTRPLLQGDNPLETISRLMVQRAPIYEEAADIIVDVSDKEMENVLQEIVDACEVEI